MSNLETVDLNGVEILAIGGPIYGQGSPPDGDYWTSDELAGMAAAAAELGDELRPPAKIGHAGDQPAVGWLTNIRLNGDGSKLLADIRQVPRKLADLIKAGAYRTRSVELSRVTSQRTGKVYDWAVTGLAWLGGRLPAVQTLDDVVALYEGAVVERRRLTVSLEEDEYAGEFARRFGFAPRTVRLEQVEDAERYEIAARFGIRAEEVI